MTLKPGVSVRTHLLLAALLWSAVGGMLLARGLLAAHGIRHGLALGILGISLGTLKSLFALDRTAVKNIDRILRFRDKTCIGGVYSWRTWLFVFTMIGGGRWLRGSGLPPEVVSILFFAVGWGLLLSSRLAWQAWRQTAG